MCGLFLLIRTHSLISGKGWKDQNGVLSARWVISISVWLNFIHEYWSRKVQKGWWFLGVRQSFFPHSVNSEMVEVQYFIVWCGQMTFRISRTIPSICRNESSFEFAPRCIIEFPSRPATASPELEIGVVPAAVPYARTIIEGENLTELIESYQHQLEGGFDTAFIPHVHFHLNNRALCWTDCNYCINYFLSFFF